jgi:hypothetical protein
METVVAAGRGPSVEAEKSAPCSTSEVVRTAVSVQQQAEGG